MRKCFLDLVDNPLNFTFNFLLKNMTHKRRHTCLEIWELDTFYFLKISIFLLNLNNFRERKYRSTDDLPINNHYTPTLTIAQTKIHDMRNMLGRWNDTNLPSVMKLQVSEVGLVVQNNPKRPKIHRNHWILEMIYNQFYKTTYTHKTMEF